MKYFDVYTENHTYKLVPCADEADIKSIIKTIQTYREEDLEEVTKVVLRRVRFKITATLKLKNGDSQNIVDNVESISEDDAIGCFKHKSFQNSEYYSAKNVEKLKEFTNNLTNITCTIITKI